MLNRIPKINLHLHLDGSFRMDTIWKLAHEQNVEILQIQSKAMKPLFVSVQMPKM